MLKRHKRQGRRELFDDNENCLTINCAPPQVGPNAHVDKRNAEPAEDCSLGAGQIENNIAKLPNSFGCRAEFSLYPAVSKATHWKLKEGTLACEIAFL
jgi:hypothetical protein